MDIISPRAALENGVQMSYDKVEIGDILKAARTAKKISASALGQMLEPPVSATAIYKWERNDTEPNLSHLKQLSIFLDIDLGAVFGFGDDAYKLDLYLSRMTENQRNAVICVARAMVDC